MGDTHGFLKIKRQGFGYRPVCERIKDFCEVCILPEPLHSEGQASRCMDCGTPFCNWACPIGNYIPEWNDLVFHKKWDKAWKLLSMTNNFPEFTGRLCPAMCEYSCVLGINDDPVSIRENELAIIEYAFKNNLVKPNIPLKKSGKSIAIIGSGPAGLACADQLNKAGHNVVVFEKDNLIGGILRYGIPEFKLEKWVIDRRLDILAKEGIKFVTNKHINSKQEFENLNKEFDAICLTGGSRIPRDLNIDGRNLKGIYFAMDYLIGKGIDVKGKKVVVIGGGDTGADCVGQSHRQGAGCVVQIEILPQPNPVRTAQYPWPKYPVVLKKSSSHEEGGERKWSILTKKFIGNKEGCIDRLLCVKVDDKLKEIPSTEFAIEADIVILALGFLHPEHKGLVQDIGILLDERGDVKTNTAFMTSQSGVFCAGDMRRGQSLIVWAIYEGRRVAEEISRYL